MDLSPQTRRDLRARVKAWDAARDRWKATPYHDRDAIDSAKHDLIMAGADLAGYVDGLLSFHDPEAARD